MEFNTLSKNLPPFLPALADEASPAALANLTDKTRKFMTYTPRKEIGILKPSIRGSKRRLFAEKNGLLNSLFYGSVEDEFTVFINPFLANVYFPRQRTEAVSFACENPYCRVEINTDSNLGLPYGGYARLVFLDLLRRARTQRSAKITLGSSFNEYIRELGLDVNGRVSMQLQDSLNRMRGTYFFIVKAGSAQATIFPTINKADFLEKSGGKNKLKFWEHELTLSQGMLDLAFLDGFPADFRIFSRLVKNTLAFDLMLFLSWHFSELSKSAKGKKSFPLDSLQQQFYPGAPMPLFEFKRKLRNNVKILFEINSELEKFISFDARGNVLVITNTPNQR